jgi:DNA modification methylase
MSEDGFIAFTESWMERFRDNLKVGGVFYICSGYHSYVPFLYAIKKTGMTFSAPIIWIKNNTTMGWADYHRKQEMVLKGKREKKNAVPILYGWNRGRHFFSSDRFEADVWEHPRRVPSKMLHPTQKPLSMVQRAIKNSTRPGELVLDAFSGSGTTMIAAEREGRKAALIELDPYYCDVIIRRYASQGGATEEDIRATCKQAEIPAEAKAKMAGLPARPLGRAPEDPEAPEPPPAKPHRAAFTRGKAAKPGNGKPAEGARP